MNLYKLHSNPEHLDHYNDVGKDVNEFDKILWYKNGALHRDGDLPAVEKSNGEKQWFKNGESYREDDKPSVEAANGSLFWYQGDILHRETGPAAIYSNGREDYYFNDHYYEKDEWEQKVKKSKNLK